MDELRHDVRFALTLLRKEKTFSAAVLLTLAVCIGANVALYSVIHTVLLEPLPFAEPDRLVTVYNSYPNAGAPRGSAGPVDFFQRREHVPAFEEVALFRDGGSTVGEAGSTERVGSLSVTPSLFPLLRVTSAVGRTFTEDEMEEGSAATVVLTDGYWREHFGGRADVVGRTLRVDGRPREVVGVLPADFHFPGAPDARIVLPLAFSVDDRDLESWHSNNFEMMARLAPGATVEQARAQNRALNASLMERWPIPDGPRLLEDAGYAVVVVPAGEDLIRDVAPVLYLLWAGVGLVFLIGCVNVANLVLARARTRQAEMATRLALGAPRRRVARQVLTESVVLGVAGGVLGTGVGAVGLRMLLSLGAAELPRGTRIELGPAVLLFTLALSVGAGVLFGAVPMFQLLRSDLAGALRTEGRSGTPGRRSVAVRNALVTAQVALAFVLLIGSGLTLASFRAALDVEPGFDPEGVLTGFISLPQARYPDGEARRQLTGELIRRLKALPGVREASLTSMLPFTGSNASTIILPEGYVPGPGESILAPLSSFVGPGYFEAMGIPLRSGRTFLESDGPDARRVMVIDEWLASRYWPDRSPLEERMIWGVVPGSDDVPPESLYTVVGVVGTTKHSDLTAPASEHVGAYFFPLAQQTASFLTVVVRAASDPAALTPGVRTVLAGLDPELPLFGVETLAARLDASLAPRRIPMVLLAVFAGVAVFLAVVGIYGALAYSVTQRTREIGIRMAMGSAPTQVFRAVVLEGLRVTGTGLVAGAAASLLLTRLVQSMLFQVEATDPGILATVAAVMALVGLAACLVPARRATTVDPVTALGG